MVAYTSYRYYISNKGAQICKKYSYFFFIYIMYRYNLQLNSLNDLYVLPPKYPHVYLYLIGTDDFIEVNISNK